MFHPIRINSGNSFICIIQFDCIKQTKFSIRKNTHPYIYRYVCAETQVFIKNRIKRLKCQVF